MSWARAPCVASDWVPVLITALVRFATSVCATEDFTPAASMSGVNLFSSAVAASWV